MGISLVSRSIRVVTACAVAIPVVSEMTISSAPPLIRAIDLCSTCSASIAPS